MKKKTKKNLSFFAVYSHVAKDFFRAKPAICIIFIPVAVLSAVFMVATVALTAMLFENIEQSLSLGTDANIWLFLAAILIVLVVSNFIQAIRDYIGGQMQLHYQRFAGVKMFKKSANIDPIMYEDSKLFDEMTKAQEGINQSADQGYNMFDILFGNIIYFILFGVFLFSLQPIFILALIFALIPAFVGKFVRMRNNTKLQDEIAPVSREYLAYESMTYHRDFFKETRILGIFPHFKRMYISLAKLLNKKRWKVESKNLWIELGTGIFSLLGYTACLVMLFIALFNGHISVGAFAAVFASLGTLFEIINGFVFWRLGPMIDNFGVIRNYVNFMKLPNKQASKQSTDGDFIFKNVSFTYPNSKHAALKNINLTLKQNETIAIVGENGAGKSTLVKLLLGIYTATNGRVTVGNKNIKRLGYANSSAVFQNFQRYMMTAGENIKISDSSLNNNKYLAESAAQADLPLDNIDVLPQGLETMLSREFEGVELSGGQWQRVALARGLYRRHNTIVLDEPTAAIDPLEETRIYKKFAKLAKGKTAIVVTHRLGSARIANRIIVMKDGQIVEEGNHDSLICKNGIYAEMFASQSDWYNRTQVIEGAN